MAGCSFDFAPFGNGSGGSGGSLVANGPSATSANATSANATGSGGATTSGSASSGATTTTGNAASSSSSGAGGAPPMPLAACGAVTDDFATFPSATWMTFGAASNPGGAAQLQVMPGESSAGAFTVTSNLDECVTTIELGTQPTGNGGVYLNLRQSGSPSEDVSYFRAITTLVYPGGSKVLAGTPQAIGIALKNGNIYYLARTAGTWAVESSAIRPGWLAGNVSIGFGLASSSNGKNATFDNFNLTPVYPSDLGL